MRAEIVLFFIWDYLTSLSPINLQEKESWLWPAKENCQTVGTQAEPVQTIVFLRRVLESDAFDKLKEVPYSSLQWVK